MEKNIKLKFGEPGTERWFGGPDTAESLVATRFRDVLPKEWLIKNAKAAIARIETLPPDHPFRTEITKLEKLID